MTIQFGNHTATVSISGNHGSETYEVLSVRNAQGHEVTSVSSLMLDHIEEAIEDELMIQRYEEKRLDNEIAHLSHLYF